jgi:hypothetical protein
VEPGADPSTSGSVAIESDGTIVAAHDGIFTGLGGTGAVSVTVNGSITASGNAAIEIRGGVGGVSIVSNGSLTDLNGQGISADASNGGSMSVTASGTIHAGQDGIIANAGANDAVINSAIITSGGNGITMTDGGGDGPGIGTVSVMNTGQITAGSGGIGVNVVGPATGSITNTALISAGGMGISLSTTSGNATVTNGGNVSSAGGGIFVGTSTGNLSIQDTGAITAGGSGIVAFGSGNENVSVSGPIDAGDQGLLAVDFGNGSVNVNTSGIITTHFNGSDGSQSGITAYIPNGSGSIAVNVGASIHGNGVPVGIAANAQGAGASRVTIGSGTVASPMVIDGTTFFGIVAESLGGPASVTTGAYVDVGTPAAPSPQFGIGAVTFAPADPVGGRAIQIAIGPNNTILTKGNGGYAIGALEVNPSGTGGISISVANGINIGVSGFDAEGIAAANTVVSDPSPYFPGYPYFNTGDVTVTVGTGTINVNSTGATGPGNSPNAASVGINANGSGNVLVDNAAAISVVNSLPGHGAAGIFASTQNAGSVTVNSRAPVASAEAIAILGVNGQATINLIAGTATGTGVVGLGGTGLFYNGNGVFASTSGTGNVQINLSPLTSASGASGAVATSAGGAVRIANAGTVLGITQTVNAAMLMSPTSITLNNQPGALIRGLGDAVSDATVGASGGGAVAITNGGTITTVQPNHAGVAINVAGGPSFSLSNTSAGRVDGTVTASDHVTFANAGTWTSVGVSNFGTTAGAATNVINNTGMVLVGQSAPGAVATTSGFSNLGVFNNGATNATGTVSLKNGVAGDVLNIAGRFNGAKGYSKLVLDVSLGGPGSAADRVNLSAGSSGQTLIAINDTNTGAGALNPQGITIVTGVTSAANFALDPSAPNYNKHFQALVHGVFLYPLSYVQGKEVLVGVPGPRSLEGEDLMDDDDDDAMDSIGQRQGGNQQGGNQQGQQGGNGYGNGGSAVGHVWFRTLNGGSRVLSDANSLFGALPQNYGTGGALASGTSVTTANVSAAGSSLTIRNNSSHATAAVVSGLNLFSARTADAVFSGGVLSGYAQSREWFGASQDFARLEGPLAGLYASYASERLDLSASILTDTLSGAYVTQGLGIGADRVHLRSAAFRINAEYTVRLDDSFSLDPVASIMAKDTSLNDIALGDGTTAHFRRFDTVRGSVGLVASYLAGWSDSTLRSTMAIRVSDEVQSDDTMVLISGASQFAVPRGPSRPYAEFDTGLSFSTDDSSFATFVSAATVYGATRTAASAIAGVQLHW